MGWGGGVVEVGWGRVGRAELGLGAWVGWIELIHDILSKPISPYRQFDDTTFRLIDSSPLRHLVKSSYSVVLFCTFFVGSGSQSWVRNTVFIPALGEFQKLPIMALIIQSRVLWDGMGCDGGWGGIGWMGWVGRGEVAPNPTTPCPAPPIPPH